MADPERISPPEESRNSSASSAPLFRSEKEEHGRMAAKGQPFPPRRYDSGPPKRRRNFCCRCLCCTFCLFLLLIAAVAIAAGILYVVFQPRIPKYSVDSIQIARFAVGKDGTVSSQFLVGVTARNPNKKIGIYYLDNSYLAVFYSETELSRGSLPVFYQGHKNTSDLNVVLTGSNVQIGSAEMSSLSAEQKDGKIPLLLKVDVPMKIKFGKLKTMKITFHVRCDLLVNSLQANTNVNISYTKCKVKR